MRRALRAAGLVASMGTVSDCFDSALAESFFATLQTELLDRQYWTTTPARHAVFDYIEGFYNRRRATAAAATSVLPTHEKMTSIRSTRKTG